MVEFLKKIINKLRSPYSNDFTALGIEIIEALP